MSYERYVPRCSLCKDTGAVVDGDPSVGIPDEVVSCPQCEEQEPPEAEADS